MPVVVRKSVGDNFENHLDLAREEWYLPQQIAVLEEWLQANEGALDPSFAWVADVGFTGRPDASGGGPILSRAFMERCVRANLEIWLSEYRESDAGRYGKVVDGFVGGACAATLATNSIKLAFGHGQKGDPYVWIDPPWRFEHDEHCVTTATEYSEDTFTTWSGLLGPLRHATLLAWTDGERATTFSFDGGYRLVVPWLDPDGDDEHPSWYSRWYAATGKS